jgi:hypothetical protein
LAIIRKMWRAYTSSRFSSSFVLPDDDASHDGNEKKENCIGREFSFFSRSLWSE